VAWADLKDLCKLPKPNRFYRFVCKLGRAVTKLTGGLEIIGKENIESDSGLIITANHFSFADPPILAFSSPRQISFMAKSELFKVPILKQILLKLEAFPVKRGKFDRSAITNAVELLNNERVLAMFFEGGRNPDGKLMKPTLGMATIALKANVPIIPAAIIGTDRLMPYKGGFHRSHLKVIFGHPVYISDFRNATDRELVKAISKEVALSVAELLKNNGAANMVPDNYLMENDG